MKKEKEKKRTGGVAEGGGREKIGGNSDDIASNGTENVFPR